MAEGARITIDAQLQFRHDVEANWLAADPILKVGEPAYTIGYSDRFKLGDGQSKWSELPYLQLGGGGGGGSQAYESLAWSAIKTLSSGDASVLAQAYAVKQAYNELKSLIPNLADYYTKEQINALIPSLEGYATEAWVLGKGYATESFVNTKIADLINGAPTTLDTLKEIADAFAQSQDVIEALDEAIGKKASQSDLTALAARVAANEGNITGLSNNKLDKSLFDTLFAPYYNEDGELESIEAKVSLWSNGEITALGQGTGGSGGGSGEGGADLLDVWISIAGNTDAYKDYQVNASHLTAYLTRAQIQETYATKEDLENIDIPTLTESDPIFKASAAYGITSTDISNWNSIRSAIPTSLSDLANDVGYITSSAIPTTYAWSAITGKPSFATVATSGSYNDLSNKPSIPSIAGLASESWVSNNFLGLSGGTLTGTTTLYNQYNSDFLTVGGTTPLTLTITREGGWAVALFDIKNTYNSSTARGSIAAYGNSGTVDVIYIGFGSENFVDASFRVTQNALYHKTNTIIHSGNYSSYAVKYVGDSSVDNARHSIGYDDGGRGSANLPEGFSGGFISADDGDYGFQMFGAGSTHKLFFRPLFNGSFRDWSEIIHSGNIGSQSVNYATSAGNAGTLDGYSSESFARCNFYNTEAGNVLVTLISGMHRWGVSATNMPEGGAYGNSLVVRGDNSAADTAWVLYGNYSSNRLFYASGYCGEGFLNSEWKEVAFMDSNVASATKLQTARTIWGQSFDGTGNVDGMPTFGASDKYQTTITIAASAIKIGAPNSGYTGYHNGIAFTALNYGSYSNHIHGWIGLGGYTTVDAAECYPLVFATNGSTVANTAPAERMRITPDGNVLIGTTTDNGAKLQVEGTVMAKGFKAQTLSIECDSTGSQYGGYGWEINNFNNPLYIQSRTNANLFLCTAGGYVGIGTTAPSHELDVQGNIFIPNYYALVTRTTNGILVNLIYAGNDDVVKIGGGLPILLNGPSSVNGDLTASGEITALGSSSSSDIRLKNIVSRPTPLTLEDIAKLNVISFKWNHRENDKRLKIGLVAQEVQEILPELVGVDRSNYLTFDYSTFGGVVGVMNTKEILSVKSEVEALKDRVSALENEIERRKIYG